MAGIQQGINQLFTTAGFMAGLNPEWRAAAEKRAKIADLEGQTKDIKAAAEVITEDLKSKIGTPGFKEAAEFGIAKVEEAEAKAGELFGIDPNKERYQKIQNIREAKTAMKSIMDQLREKGKAKIEQKAQRRNFMKALGSEEVNFGSGTEGTVSELPKNLQKAIAAQYSKSERKELMDKYYGK